MGHIYFLLHITPRAHVDLDSTLYHPSEAFIKLGTGMTRMVAQTTSPRFACRDCGTSKRREVEVLGRNVLGVRKVFAN